jgi:hypothetical protein
MCEFAKMCKFLWSYYIIRYSTVLVCLARGKMLKQLFSVKLNSVHPQQEARFEILIVFLIPLSSSKEWVARAICKQHFSVM